MTTTIEEQASVVTNGEMQAAKELCARLERIGLLARIEVDDRSRHPAYVFTTKGKEAMSFQTGIQVGRHLENASGR